MAGPSYLNITFETLCLFLIITATIHDISTSRAAKAKRKAEAKATATAKAKTKAKANAQAKAHQSHTFSEERRHATHYRAYSLHPPPPAPSPPPQRYSSAPTTQWCPQRHPQPPAAPSPRRPASAPTPLRPRPRPHVHFSDTAPQTCHPPARHPPAHPAPFSRKSALRPSAHPRPASTRAAEHYPAPAPGYRGAEGPGAGVRIQPGGMVPPIPPIPPIPPFPVREGNGWRREYGLENQSGERDWNVRTEKGSADSWGNGVSAFERRRDQVERLAVREELLEKAKVRVEEGGRMSERMRRRFWQARRDGGVEGELAVLMDVLDGLEGRGTG